MIPRFLLYRKIISQYRSVPYLTGIRPYSDSKEQFFDSMYAINVKKTVILKYSKDTLRMVGFLDWQIVFQINFQSFDRTGLSLVHIVK